MNHVRRDCSKSASLEGQCVPLKGAATYPYVIRTKPNPTTHGYFNLVKTRIFVQESLSAEWTHLHPQTEFLLLEFVSKLGTELCIEIQYQYKIPLFFITSTRLVFECALSEFLSSKAALWKYDEFQCNLEEEHISNCCSEAYCIIVPFGRCQDELSAPSPTLRETNSILHWEQQRRNTSREWHMRWVLSPNLSACQCFNRINIAHVIQCNAGYTSIVWIEKPRNWLRHATNERTDPERVLRARFGLVERACD